MNYKLDGLNQQKSERQRRARQQKSRNSPNSKLLNAAWPTAPTNPTRKSQIKAVNHDEFAKSWGQWRNHAFTSGECSIEDMDVDMDTDDEIAAATKMKRPSPRPSNQLKSRDTLRGVSLERKETSSTTTNSGADEHRQTLRAKRTNEATPAAVPDSTTRRTTRSTAKSGKPLPQEENTEISSTTTEKKVESQSDSRCKPKEQHAIFIIIHVNKVELSKIKGPATTPVKVYAEKFMIQMENEFTKKDLSFRVPCKKIISLEMCLTEKPFFIKFTTKEIQYIQGQTNSRKSKGGQDTETIILHLAYEDHVPNDVKNDLKELFQVRLSEQNLWPKDKENDSVSEKVKKKEFKQDLTVDTQTDTVKITKDVPSPKLVSPKPTHQHLSSTLSVRKRTPMKITKVKENEENDSADPVSYQAKIARRTNQDMNDVIEERIKTLSHEAAHYQMVSAQQRMIIHALEDDVRQKTLLTERTTESRLKEHEDKVRCDLDVEKQDLSEQLKMEQDLVKSLEEQVATVQKEIEEKDRLHDEQLDAVRVRDETIQQLRSTMRRHSVSEKSSPRKAEKKEATVPFSAMEETRQNLMQMQVSKENLAVELQQTREDLITRNSDVQTLRLQLDHVTRDLQAKNDSFAEVRSEFITSQEELVRKNELVRSLTSQLNEARRVNSSETDDLRGELTDTKLQLDEVKCELNDTKARMVENQELVNQRQQISRDWILERGEINMTEKIIGVGAWGNVKVGKFRGINVAVKQIHLLILSPHNRRLFEREMAIASRCRHPCLVQFIGATNDDGTPLFLMELLETDLRSLLTREALGNQDCLQLGFDVIRALNYLHLSRPVSIIHRDISSSNVLLYYGRNGWRGKLSDYGAANFMRLSMTRHPGALLYSAPEASTIDQTTKLDVYSFGVLFCEMCSRELPVPENRHEQIAMVTNSDYKTLIINCLRRDLSKRLDSKDVLLSFERWIKEFPTAEG